MKLSKYFVLGLWFASSLQLVHAATVTVPGDSIGGGQLSGSVFTIGFTGGSNGLNNFPSNEPPANAIDAILNNKYLNFGGPNTGYIVTPAGGLSNVTSIAFSTGDDAPERDPLSFSLYGSNTATASSTNGTTFDLSDFSPITLNLSSGFGTDPGRNSQGPNINLANAANYTTYILVFPALRGPNTSIMQVGGAVLSGTFVPEPSGVIMLGASAMGLLARRRRSV